MLTPRLSVAPLPNPDGGKPRLGLFANGILVPGVKALFADADILVVIDRDAVRIDPSFTPEPVFPAGMCLATDGQA